MASAWTWAGPGAHNRAVSLGWLLALAYVATIFAANLAIQLIGPVPVGAALSAAMSLVLPGPIPPLRLALASGSAFLFSELLDFAVYTPLRRRSWLGAVAASNAVGLVADSALFLTLAFGSLDFLAGQIVGKAEMTLLAVALL